jgi:hypothetical protein
MTRHAYGFGYVGATGTKIHAIKERRSGGRTWGWTYCGWPVLAKDATLQRVSVTCKTCAKLFGERAGDAP